MKLNKIISIAIIACMSLISNGCGFQSYIAKPIKPSDISTKLELRSPSNLEFQEFLKSQNYPENQLPITVWGENELTLSALFFHPDLNVARTLLRRAQSAEITAAQHPEIGVNGGLENHSQSNDKSPWTYRLAIDVPIITGNKREAQIAIAAGISEATRIEVALTAWNVHSRVAKSLLEYQHSLALSSILKNEVAMRNSIAEMLIKRLDVGMASSIEVSNARIALQKAEQAYLAESGRTPVLAASLSSDSGLGMTAFNKLPVKPFEEATEINIGNLQYQSLLNRLDIRASLARYEAAEANLRLEIAKQYPDITLSPSKTLDQGDRIWSLGFSSLLTLINKNRGMIAEANSLREVEVAQFEALQSKVISDLNQAKAAYDAALQATNKTKALLTSQQKLMQQNERQFNAGLTDRLEFTNTRLENIIATENMLNSSYQLHLAKLNLEDVLQRPLDDRLTVQSSLSIADNISNRNNLQ